MSQLSDVKELTSDYYYGQMNSTIEQSLSFEQKQEVKRVLSHAIKVPSKKIVNCELTFWFFKRFYLVLYLGFDRRVKRRAAYQGAVRTITRLTFTGLLYTLLWGSTLIVFAMVIYYTKMVIGIDIDPDRHFYEILFQ